MRRKETVTIEDAGRDIGKTFILTEMPADQGEQWAMRALLALTNAGATLPDLDGGGMAALAQAGVEALARLPYESVQPLLDEMFTCVRYQPPNPNVPSQAIISGEGSQIEEIRTRLMLRVALFKLHTGFSKAG